MRGLSGSFWLRWPTRFLASPSICTGYTATFGLEGIHSHFVSILESSLTSRSSWSMGKLYFAESFLCVIPPTFTAIYVFHGCQGACSSMTAISRHLHGIRRNIRDKKSGDVILQFSLQILQSPMQLTGYGFFEINYDLMHSVKSFCFLNYLSY